MASIKGEDQPWREPQIVFENEHWTITDYRPEETFQVVSARGFGFTILYEEWKDYIAAVRQLETDDEVDTDLVAAARVEGENGDAPQWYFNLLYPDHMLSFFCDEAEWNSLQEAIEASAEYPWSEMLFRVDAERMRLAIDEQKAWLQARKGNG